MFDYVFAPPQQSYVPVAGGGRFPVRRVYCIGRNYRDHAVEMGHDPQREPPFFFMKPADALVIDDADTPYPSATSDLHYEIEMVVAIGTGGRDIPVVSARDHVWGYAAGLDLTRRNLQAIAKKLGRPWDLSKGFDHSAPIGSIAPIAVCGHPPTGAIFLDVNGLRRQSADLSQLIWSVPEAISVLSALVELRPGDLLFTGTPAGVGPAFSGDELVGGIDGIGSVRTHLVG